MVGMEGSKDIETSRADRDGYKNAPEHAKPDQSGWKGPRMAGEVAMGQNVP